MAVAAAVATAVAAAVAAAVAVAAAELLPLKQEITGSNLTGFKAFSTPHILRQSTIDIYVSPLPCDVTLQVSDMSLVSLLHGIVRPDARCTVPLLQDLEAGSVPGIDVYFSVFTLIKLQFGVFLSLYRQLSQRISSFYISISLSMSLFMLLAWEQSFLSYLFSS